MFSDRLKELRKALGLSQDEFAKKIIIGRSSIANYESGTREPISSVIALICKTWNVNENWLRNGEGEMFVEVSRDDEFLQLIEKSMTEESGEFKRRLAMAIMKLTPEQINTCREWVKENWNLAEPTATDPKQTEIDQKVEEYREELEAEAASNKSEASQTGSEDIVDEA